MPLFEDTVTIYNKLSASEWKRTVVHGVQWSDKTEKVNDNGKIRIVRYGNITFPEGTYDGLHLSSKCEEDCIVRGEVADAITGEKGYRVSDILEKYEKSGLIQSVNDNSNRNYLKNIKVVVA